MKNGRRVCPRRQDTEELKIFTASQNMAPQILLGHKQDLFAFF
jgi:hypothetical protein